MRALMLNQGRFAVVDDADWDLVSGLNWYIWTTDGRKTYAKASTLRDGVVYLHRMIMAPGEGLVVRHRNGSGLDCRRSNMVACTRAESLQPHRRQGISTPDGALHNAAVAYMRGR